MFSQLSEKLMHGVRWGLALGWLLLIASLFYDPITPQITATAMANNPVPCVQLQDKCLEIQPYAMGTQVFWGLVIRSAVVVVVVFGHELWRRICPLYFFSQIPRALGWEPKLDVQENQWLQRNHLYLQFGLFFIGLNARLLFINSNRILLGSFLLFTIVCAIGIVFLYGGRSWCHYVCPFGMVQMVLIGPRTAFATEAHMAPRGSITQSMCRTVDLETKQEISACMTCKKPCMDIDSEGAYWQQINKHGRKLAHYGYLGIVLGYLLYFPLYSGNSRYYFSGAWVHTENQLKTLFSPGFYINGEAILIPKIVAVPLTLTVFIGGAYLILSWLEKALLSMIRRRDPALTKEDAAHKMFSLCTFIGINFFFIYGVTQPQLPFKWVALAVSSLWLYKTWSRSSAQYEMEDRADKLRRKLENLPIDFTQSLNGRSLKDLKANELDLLYNVLPNVTKKDRLKMYKDIIKDSLSEGNVKPAYTVESFSQLRQKMVINDDEHNQVLEELSREYPELFYPPQQKSSSNDITQFGKREKTTSDRTWLGGDRPNSSEDRTQFGRPQNPNKEDDRTQFGRPQDRDAEEDRTHFGRPQNPNKEDDRTHFN